MITAGIDIGSSALKLVILESTGKVLARYVGRAGYGSGARAREFCKSVGVNIDATVATGYGRGQIDWADKSVTELTCQVRWARQERPAARTIIDIGGQDCKVMRISESGTLADFLLNDKCAAGTGRFLEVMAAALEVPVEELGSVPNGPSAGISSTCTVFAESEVMSAVASGLNKEEVIRGINDAVASRVATLALRLGCIPEVVITGGVAQNARIVSAISRILGTRPIVPKEPQLTAAWGAALLAHDKFC
ncbi:MAG: acyl-CoA dehydratase activase [Bacillota bacterium]